APLEPSVGAVHRAPGIERALRRVQRPRRGMETEADSTPGEPGGKLHVFGSPEGGIESTRGEDLLASDGSVARPELAEGRRPVAARHGGVLVLEHRLLPGDPGL